MKEQDNISQQEGNDNKNDGNLELKENLISENKQNVEINENKNEEINTMDNIKIDGANLNNKNEEIEKNSSPYSLLPEFIKELNNDPNENIDEFLKDSKNRFNSVNPLRIRKSIYKKEKNQEKIIQSKKVAIKELVTNLKAQYILFKVKDFIREYHIKENPNINKNMYKMLLIFRNSCLYIYGLIMIFERPWFCYKGTTIPLSSRFTFIPECDKTVSFMNIPFIYNNLLRVIEITQTVIILVTQLIKYKIELSLKMTNTGVNKYYNIIQIFLFITLFLCLADLIFSLYAGKFPIINFLFRPFIYIFLIRRIRRNWISLLKVLWKTKMAYLALFINMFTFSSIGYALFKKEYGFFETFSESFLQLYILLSTCNFPDIMLEAMEFSKFAIIYFFIYISINYFIILSYLQTLYTTQYNEVNKRDCLNIIKNIIENKYNKYIYNVKKFKKFLLQQKKIYSLNDEEYNNFLILFNLNIKNTDVFAEITKIIETTPENEMISKTKYGKYILKSKKIEIIINLLCIISTATLFSKSRLLLIFHFFISCFFLYEPIILIKYLGFKRVLAHHFNRIVFHIFNLAVIICIFYLFILNGENDEIKIRFDYAFKIFRIFISLRTMRILVFIDKFRIIKNIYIIIRVSKEMIYRHLLLLYSFILLFSTLSILLTGGNIKKKSFADENDNIPENYEYINFNDFGSSYISCFCLLMINNLNILVKSLTYQSRHKMFFQFYFATFYFFSTLILINIIQTLLLEMYLISDNSISDKEVKKGKDEIKENIRENKTEKLINETED